MHSEELEALLVQGGSATRRLSKRERWSVEQKWRETFAVALHDRLGRWTDGGFDWHVLSSGDCPTISGARALSTYALESPDAFYVRPEDSAIDAFACTGGTLPSLAALNTDIHVFPATVQWTMAFTHEIDAGFGPYFARRPS